MSLKQHGLRIGVLLVLVGALLGWLSFHTEVVFADGLRYIRQAQTLDRGAWADGVLKAVDHPVYPLEIVVAHRLLGGDGPESWQAAAQAASVVAGLLLVVPLYLVARELFGDGSAWLACLLTYAVPLTGHVFADALSESTFLLFWTTGLWTGLRFLREGRFGWLPPTILLAVLAYLSRPEGFLLPAALVATLGVLPCSRTLRMKRSRWWAAVTVLLIGPACLIGPYVAVKGGFGTKPSIARLLGTAPKATPLSIMRSRPLDPNETPVETYANAAKAVFEAVRDVVTIPLIPLVLVGFLTHRWDAARARAWLFVAIIVLAALAALWRLHATGGYCTPRHALIVALLLFPAAAAGIQRTITAVADYGSRWGPRAAHMATRPVAWVVVLGGLAGVFAPRTTAPLNTEFAGYRAAGLWLRQHVPADARVVDLTGWALFYGRRQGYTFANLIQIPTDPSIRWVVAREAHLRGPWPYCDQLRALVGDSTPVAVFQGTHQRHTPRVFVFDRSRAASTPTAQDDNKNRRYY